MIINRKFAAAALSVALVFTSISVAVGAPRRQAHKPKPAYRVTKPAVVSSKVNVGAAFDTTGLVAPAIAADDASTSVSIEVRRLNGPRKSGVLLIAPAVLSAVDASRTLYSASVTLTSAGEFSLVAVVTRDGKVLARTTGRPVRAVLPYRIAKPRVDQASLAASAAFDATGYVLPVIADGDTSTSIAIIAYKVGRHNKLTKVGTFDGSFTGAFGTGTGYTASVLLTSNGRYVLVAVLSRDGTVLGRSAQRPIHIKAAPVS